MRASRVLLATSAALLLALTATSPAAATYPGVNGDLAFGANIAGNVDVYALSPGMTSVRLTEDPGFDACAAYDATGERIAFCSNRTGATEIWTMGSDGSDERQLTHLGGFAIFPDFAPRAPRVAFSLREPGAALLDIWTVRDDGRHPRQLTDTPELDELYPAYSPDGRWIAFMRRTDGSDTQLWIMDRHGARQRQLTFDDLPKDQLPDWHPSGDRIAYHAGEDVWLIDPDGSDRVNLTNTPGVNEYGATWSPDGSRLAYLNFGLRIVYTMAADGSDVQVAAPGLGGTQFVPAWQPLQRRGR